MSELNKGIYFGANIIGGEGGSNNTKAVCDDLSNDFHYTLSEVNRKGAVTKDADKRFQRLTVKDYKEGGVQVLRGTNDNPFLKPGQTLQVEVGSHTLTIKGTDSRGVLLNGKNPTKATDKNERIRYPHT
ncbi:MAG: hypothetical protein AAB856_00500 [Patescibacteria group bacterium]